MKSTVETLSPTRVRLSVEVPYEEFAPHLTQAYQQVGAQVKVPGFRPGKAPRAVIDQRVGKDAIHAQAIDNALPRKIAEAYTDNDIKALGRPEVDFESSNLEQDQPFSFTVEVDVAPEIVLPELSELTVTVDGTEVTDEQVDDEIENLRLRFGTLKTVERAVQNGDFVTIDLKATVDGEEVEGGTAGNMSHEVGSGDLLEGLDETLVGMTAEETREFTSTLAGGDHAGREATVEVKVNSVKERELPELDDDFAQLASEHDTLEELREASRNQLAARAEATQLQQARERTAEALVAAVDIPVPEGVIDDEVKHRRSHLDEQLSAMGANLDTYLASQGQTVEEFEAELKETASNGLRRQLILDKVAETTEVQVTSELLTSEIIRRAQQQGVPQDRLQEFANTLQQRGLIPGIAAEVRQGLALEEVVRLAKIVDTSGAELDNDTLFPNAAGAAEESDEDENTDETATEAAETAKSE
ncbi:trigger factor [Stackebrandtia albiflava]|uniref:Trigger factor n=1 Tax=Stackebrandtia albiflava TaxID=406432 RepID=A0A562V9R8_9ACTN|nr:trigger factor [Stackebrandtia albiflava]TWJ14603.1 trigger factor [Stackebrandtia albiflava]